jgi:hypothetical protein
VRLRQHTEAWLEHRRRIGKIRPRTETRYRELLEPVWSLIGNPKLAAVDADTLQTVVDDIAARGLDPTQTFAVFGLRCGSPSRSGRSATTLPTVSRCPSVTIRS